MPTLFTDHYRLLSERSLQAKVAEKPFYCWFKRISETLVALVILVLFAPVWLIIALAIKLTSPGPVLFRGRVVGKDGREFTYYKFRSMQHNNDNREHYRFIVSYVSQAGLCSASSTENIKPSFKLTKDKRITPVGQVIRKLSLDEVPQLINVIRGEMAIVGPRPPVPYEYSLYDERCKARLGVLPGITGLAQVRARGQATFQQMVEFDLEYIARRTLILDWQIMLKTPSVMLKGI